MKGQQNLNNDLNKAPAPATPIHNSQQSSSYALMSNQTPSFLQKQVLMSPEINFKRLINSQEDKQRQKVQIIEQEQINKNIFIQIFNTFRDQNDQMSQIKNVQIDQIKDFYCQDAIKEIIVNEINNSLLSNQQKGFNQIFQQKIDPLNIFCENNINQNNAFKLNSNPMRFQRNPQKIPIIQMNEVFHLQSQNQQKVDIGKLKKNQKCSFLSSNNPQSAIMRIKLFEKQRKNSSDLQNN